MSGDKIEESEGYWIFLLIDILIEINEYVLRCCLDVFFNLIDDFIFIKLGNDMFLSGCFVIYDILGWIIYFDELYDSSNSVDLRLFILGMYFFEVLIEEFIY